MIDARSTRWFAGAVSGCQLGGWWATVGGEIEGLALAVGRTSDLFTLQQRAKAGDNRRADRPPFAMCNKTFDCQIQPNT
jgi:hypothetical protein